MNNNVAFTHNDTPDGNEALRLMFEHTGEDGTLYIPEFYNDMGYEFSENYYKLKMNWDGRFDELVSAFNGLSETLEEIAAYDNICDTFDENDEFMTLPQLMVWDMYLREFDTGDIDLDRIDDIVDRYNTVEHILYIENEIEDGTATKEDIEYYDEYKNTEVTPDDEKYYKQYVKTVNTQAVNRLAVNGVRTPKYGKAAYYVIMFARRYCKLLQLNAPVIILNNEKSTLAQAMAIYFLSEEMKTVDADELLS